MKRLPVALGALGALAVAASLTRSAGVAAQEAAWGAGPSAAGIKIPELFPERAHRTVRVGDMLLDSDEVGIGEDLTSAAARYSLVLKKTHRWPGGRLPISFDDAIPPEQRSQLFEACGAWEEVAAVSCVERQGEFSHLHVVPRGGCTSSVGPGRWAWTSKREMTLGSGCWNRSILIHELGHALGLRHEHQRPDRGGYIEVLWDNIDPEHRDAYTLIQGSDDGTPYDWESIMHYSDATFVKGPGLKSFAGRPGFEAKASSAGRAWKPSAGDAAALALRYGKPR